MSNASQCGADVVADAREAAARWDVRLRSDAGGERLRREFQEWLDAAPENASAFDLLQKSIVALHGASSVHPRLRAMRDEANRARQRGRRLRLIGAAAAMVATAGLGWLLIHQFESAREEALVVSQFQTGPGERSQAQLADGSEVSLDTRSRVEIRYSQNRRDVEVLAGRAYFKVAKDAARPFVVRAGDQQVVAVGTEFDVRLDRDRLQVTLVEGRVNVEEATTRSSGAMTVVPMTAGEQLTEDRNSGVVRIAQADIERATSWRQGKVFFDDTPLADAVAEMNRYTLSPIVLDDARLAGIRISGMFYTARQDSFLLALERYFSIRSRVDADGTTRLFSNP